MGNATPESTSHRFHEYRFVLVGSFIALAITSIPYLLGTALATDECIFGGFVYSVEDGYSYLAKMRQGAEGAWLFHLPYSPEPHPGTVFYAFHLLLGKVAVLLPGSDLTSRLVWAYHATRCIFGLGLLLTIYRFLSVLTERIRVRRLAWLMIVFGGGLGWLLVALDRPYWLGSLPLDLILPEGFTFLVLYGFPHIALARTLLLWGLLSLLAAWRVEPAPIQLGNSLAPLALPPVTPFGWALMTGVLWLLMGFIVPFYVAVAWAIAGAAWVIVTIRESRPCWLEASTASAAAFVSAPIVIYTAWYIFSDPIYATWARQLSMLSPHPLHYLAAYGILITFSAFAVRDAWRSQRPTWLALAWVSVVPFLVYLPFNAQRRLVEGVQVPLSLLAAIGLTRITHLGSRKLGLRSRLPLAIALITLWPTNAVLIAGNTMALQGLPAPIFRHTAEVTALDWLSQQVAPDDVVLASYETGNYLPARAGARAFVGHGPESVRASDKKALVAEFFNATTSDVWRRQLLTEYGVDYVFWGPAERGLGQFDPRNAPYLRQIYQGEEYAIFAVE